MEKYQEKLILQYMRTADKIAHDIYKTATYALDENELKSIAYEGLCTAADRWPKYCEETGRNPEAVQFFYAYSRLRIRGAIYDHLRQVDWVPRSLRAKSRQLRNAGQDQGATVEEMAKVSGMSEKEVNKTLRDMNKRPVSLEAEEIDSVSLQSTESSALVEGLLSVVVEVIEEMDELSQVILALHYFHEIESEDKKKTKGVELQQISKILGITEPRASKIHCDSVTKIRSALALAAAGKNWQEG